MKVCESCKESHLKETHDCIRAIKKKTRRLHKPKFRHFGLKPQKFRFYWNDRIETEEEIHPEDGLRFLENFEKCLSASKLQVREVGRILQEKGADVLKTQQKLYFHLSSFPFKVRISKFKKALPGFFLVGRRLAVRVNFD